MNSRSVPVSVKDGDVMSEQNINSLFNEIYDFTNKPVLAFITAKCANTADINDIFQETYIELYKLMQKRGADYITDAKALVFRLAKQKISRHYSLFKRLNIFVSMTAKSENEDEADFSDSIADLFLIEDFVTDRIMIDNAKRFIKRKPEDVKKIFYLFYEMDKTIPEISEMLSLSESNVKNKLYRTLKELKEVLQ